MDEKKSAARTWLIRSLIALVLIGAGIYLAPKIVYCLSHEYTDDAHPGVLFKGHVDSFQPGTGSVFSLLPPENATGNFVKVVQRLAVKIVLDTPPDSAHPLWPGLSAIPYVDVDAK